MGEGVGVGGSVDMGMGKGKLGLAVGNGVGKDVGDEGGVVTAVAGAVVAGACKVGADV
jgi:hypothetical protein